MEFNIELANEMYRGAMNIAMNSYYRTRVPAGFPTEIMGKTLNQVRKYREWIIRSGFPVSLENLNLAANALTDSILEFRKTGGIFEPARYQGGADPRSAEHLLQFKQFLDRRINQKPIYGKQWAEFGKYWDLFIEDFADTLNKLKNMQ